MLEETDPPVCYLQKNESILLSLLRKVLIKVGYKYSV